jgi:hypothetical protein
MWVSVSQVEEALKNLSGNEIAQFQNMVVGADDLDEFTRLTTLELVSQELQIRQTEGLERKARRFLHRHGDKAALIAIGALLGIGLDNITS